ncbi:hypothetical protein ACI2KR_27205 [Pseudomonas luteola]
MSEIQRYKLHCGWLHECAPYFKPATIQIHVPMVLASDHDKCVNELKTKLADAVELLRKKQAYLEKPYPYGAHSYDGKGIAKNILAETKAFLASYSDLLSATRTATAGEVGVTKDEAGRIVASQDEEGSILSVIQDHVPMVLASDHDKCVNELKTKLADAVELLRKKQEYLEESYPYGAHSYGSKGIAKNILAETKAFLSRYGDKS